jgi:DUF1680 family protein
MRITGDSRYGDSMEKVLYNTVLGAYPIQPSGFSFYYSDYNNDGAKVYYPQQWPCCSGTFSQVTADYGISSYFGSKDGIVVNLFVPSRVKFRRHGTSFSLEQRTSYPYSGETTLRVTAESPQTFTVALRVPAWAGKNTSLSINGRRWDGELRPGSFASVSREWKNGDTIEYSIDMVRRLEAVDPQHPNTVALLSGPLALFALNSQESRFTWAQLLAAKQKGSQWTIDSAVAPVTFRAFPDVRHERYRLYHNIPA